MLNIVICTAIDGHSWYVNQGCQVNIRPSCYTSISLMDYLNRLGANLAQRPMIYFLTAPKGKTQQKEKSKHLHSYLYKNFQVLSLSAGYCYQISRVNYSLPGIVYIPDAMKNFT